MDIQLNKAKYFKLENDKMKIILDNYCIQKEGYIEGSIIIIPKLKGDIKLKDPKLILSLTQYEFFDYKNSSKEKEEHNKYHKIIIFNKEAKIEIENNVIKLYLKNSYKSIYTKK